MLKKENRLKTKFEFKITKKYGVKYYGKFSNLYILTPKNYSGNTKIGVVVPNTIDKRAVVRNRIRRVYREIFRKNILNIPINCWIVIYPKEGTLKEKYETICADINQVLQKIHLS